jgi:hypothetical protein
MAQFGAGAELAAQCPIVPPPDGWEPWTDANGPIPDALTQHAQALAASSALLGATESYPLPGVTTLIRIEPRVWNRDAQGNLVQGCFRTAAVYLPSAEAAATAVAPTASDGSKVVTTLTVVSLVVGTVATLATWGK